MSEGGRRHRAAVVMAGGAGERFWPMSTPERPKQLLALGPSGKTLLEDACGRMRAFGGDLWIAASEALRPGILELRAAEPSHVLAEPARRNTAGAIVWAAAALLASDPDFESHGLMAVAPADHLIRPIEAFSSTLEKAALLAEAEDRLVAIGVLPTRVETGFGYIEPGAPLSPGFAVASFREKPDRGQAEAFIGRGFLWNAGIFVWPVRRLLEEMRAHFPEALVALRLIAAALAADDREGARAAFEAMPSASIDVAVMERTARAAVVPAEFEWDDLGAWDALARALPPDPAGNVALGSSRIVDSAGCVAASDGPEVCLLGVEGLVVVAANGKVLVCPAERAQEVRRLASD